MGLPKGATILFFGGAKMNAQKSLTLSNKNGNTITINGDLHFTLDGVFYASKSAQNRKSKTGELTNSCYVSMPQGTISFSGGGVKEFFENADTTKTTTRTRTKTSDSVRVLTTYATFEEYLDKNYPGIRENEYKKTEDK